MEERDFGWIMNKIISPLILQAKTEKYTVRSIVNTYNLLYNQVQKFSNPDQLLRWRELFVVVEGKYEYYETAFSLYELFISYSVSARTSYLNTQTSSRKTNK